jgi:gamma-tubulin complex component 2
MSSAIGNSAHGVNGGAKERAASARSRLSAHEGLRNERSDSVRPGPSPQPPLFSTTHKRSASGNPRPASRAVEERRTERVQVTTKETLVSRTRSPDRRAVPQERPRATDGFRQKSTEARSREPKVEAPPSRMPRWTFSSLQDVD